MDTPTDQTSTSSSELDQNIGSRPVQKIDLKYLLNELLGLFSFEKGFFYTVKELLLRPGVSARTFLLEDRKKLMKPLLFLAFSSTIFVLLAQLTKANYNFLMFEGFSLGETEFKLGALSKWLNDNIVFANLLIGIFVTAWLRILFRRSRFNFYEIAVLICYVFGQGLLIFSLFILLLYTLSLFHVSFTGTYIWIVYTFYLIYGIGTFFSKKYLTALAAYLLGILSYILFLALIAVLVNL